MVAPAVSGVLVPTAVAVAPPPRPLSRRDRAYLSRAAAEIRVRLKNAAGEMLAAGKLLCQVRRRVGAPGFDGWLRSGAAGVKRATAYRLMSVWKVFGGVAPSVLQNIARVSLYQLAQPDVPQSLREHVVEQAADGNRFSEADMLRLIEEERRERLGRQKRADPAKDYRGPQADPRPQHDPAAVHAADNWLALLATLKPGVTLHVGCTADMENGDREVSVTMLAPNQKPRTVVRSTLEDAVIEIGGLKRQKVCRACLKPKRLDEFSRLRDSKDGRNRTCLACERERVAAASDAEPRPRRAVVCGDRGYE
ncbi:MAG: hypothetical protein U0804_28650 [Gemmataceae bacterium]